MPASRSKIMSIELVGVIMAFIVMAMTGLFAIQVQENRLESGALVRHTLAVQGRLQRLSSELRSAESDERGYLITRDEKYLEPYEYIAARLDTEIETLKQLVANNDHQSERVAEIKPLLQARLGLLKRKIDLMKDGRENEAIALLRGGEGKALMDRIGAIISDMEVEENQLRQSREERLGQDTSALQGAVFAVVVAMAGVGFLMIYVTHKQMRALVQSRDSLDAAYGELLEASEQRETLESQLRQSQKLEALGKLTGGVAHDFNNMLGVITASLNILRRKLRRGDDDCEKLIDSAQDGADRAANLVRRLLGFARMQPLEPKLIDANKTVADMSDILRRTLGGGVKLETVVARDLWKARVDPHELENALLNLAVNSRDAMPNGGTLTIKTANCRFDETINEESASSLAAEYVMIAVTDTGEGMSTEVIEKAFDPFFTTKPVGKGTGLGLSQVHGFVKQSGGNIKIVSQCGQGASIRLYLPRDTGDADVVATRGKSAPTHGEAREIILIVDDDPTSLQVTAQCVQELGYKVLEAKGAAEAIAILRARNDIAVMITDVVMPIMDGARLAREAVFRRHALKVLFVTGFSRNALLHNGALEPNVQLLMKPFTLDHLARKMRDILDQSAVS